MTIDKIQPSFKYSGAVHVAGWILFFVAPFLLSPTREFADILAEPLMLISAAIRNMLWMALFYLNLLYLTPNLLKKKETIFFVLSLGAAIIIVTLIASRVHYFFSQPMPGELGPRPDFGDPGMRPPGGPPRGHRPFDFGPPGPFVSNLLMSLMIASVSTSLVLWRDWVTSRAEEQERAFQKISSELAVLKLQISPHFLFNTLNNIRWLIRSGSANAESAVVQLSTLLRYLIYQSDQEKVPLDKEAQHIRDYVDLQRMRLSENTSVELSQSGIEPHMVIVPLLLIPLVENVFKYGDFSTDSVNHIILKVEKTVLYFSTINRIAVATEEKTGKDYGIGLENVRRRLALHYPDTHSLKISEAANIYYLDLEIIL